jgi:hypothetical protein
VERRLSYGVETVHAVEPSPPQIWIAEMSDHFPVDDYEFVSLDWDTPDTLPGKEIMTQVRYSIRGGSCKQFIISFLVYRLQIQL